MASWRDICESALRRLKVIPNSIPASNSQLRTCLKELSGIVESWNKEGLMGQYPITLKIPVTQAEVDGIGKGERFLMGLTPWEGSIDGADPVEYQPFFRTRPITSKNITAFYYETPYGSRRKITPFSAADLIDDDDDDEILDVVSYDDRGADGYFYQKLTPNHVLFKMSDPMEAGSTLILSGIKPIIDVPDFDTAFPANGESPETGLEADYELALEYDLAFGVSDEFDITEIPATIIAKRNHYKDIIRKDNRQPSTTRVPARFRWNPYRNRTDRFY